MTTQAVASVTMTAALNCARRDAMTEDPKLVVVGGGVGPLGGVFRITHGLQAELGEERDGDCPLAESEIVGGAMGMDIDVMRPVVEMQVDALRYPEFEGLVSHAAKLGNGTGGGVSLANVIRLPCAGDLGGVE